MVTRSVAVACAAIAAAATSGCVSVQQVPMQKDFWSQTDRSVMVALAKLPETAAHKAGPQGLLDVAINNAMADDLGNALKTITLDDSYGQARSEVVRRLQQKGIKSSFTEKMVDVASLQDFSGTDNSRSYASKDFRAMKPELGSADRLLLFTVVAVGTQRSYYGFVPISSPVAILRARGELIDLQTNEVLWRDDTANTAAIADPWDQPPAFQNVGAAVQQVILEARGAMIQKLFNEATPAAAPPVATLSAAAATNSAPTLAPGTPAPETLAPENRPGPGSLWNYSFHDRVFGNRDREFSVRTTTVEDSNVMEVLSSGSEQQVISTNPREIAFQTRRLSGEEFIELSPYLLASLSTPAATLRQAPRTYPGPGSVQDWKVRIVQVRREQVTVPAGHFNAYRIELAGENENALFAISSAHAANAAAADYRTQNFTYEAWYAPQVGRYVQIHHKTFNRYGNEIGDEWVELKKYELRPRLDGKG